MSHCTCEHCGAILTDSPRGYVTGCVHYPADIQTESENNMSEAVEATFSNGKWHKTVRNVGELIDELSRLPRDLRVTQGFSDGADVVVFNRARKDAHVSFEEAGEWDIEEDDSP